MRLLVLGGPRFLGRAIADTALARGHELTFFNRGQTNAELYPEVEKLRGERAGDLGASRAQLGRRDRHSGYLPDVVAASVGSTGRL